MHVQVRQFGKTRHTFNTRSAFSLSASDLDTADRLAKADTRVTVGAYDVALTDGTAPSDPTFDHDQDLALAIK